MSSPITSMAAHPQRPGLKRTCLATLLFSSLVLTHTALAAPGETSSGVDINNSATVNYSVGGTAQTALTSAVSTFKVDRKVNVTVTGGNTTTTVPGRTAVATLFNVTNTGNGSDTFTLAATNVAAGDNFDVTNLLVYADNGTTAGVFDAGDTQVAGNVTLARDTTTNYFIVADIPNTATNTQTSLVNLAATSTSTATAGADNAATVDVVVVNQSANANDTYSIQTASLGVTKTAVVISDPVNNTTNPKAIPGAVVEYTITLTNSGTTAADNVTVIDSGVNSVFNAGNVTYVAGSMLLDAASLTDAADADGGTAAGSPVNSVSVNAGTVNAGGSAAVKFRVTIN